MAINVSVQYNGGFLPDIILLTQCYYHRGIRLYAMKSNPFICHVDPMLLPLGNPIKCHQEVLSWRQPMLPPKTF